MSDKELIEKLARRFWEMDPRRWPDKPDLVLGGFANTDVRGAGGLTYGLLAEECVRQMQWTACEAAHFYRSCEGFDDRGDAEAEACDRWPSSLAPEGWKP